MTKLYACLLATTLFQQCDTSSPQKIKISNPFNQPIAVANLPEIWNEISGITTLSDKDSSMVAISDERGELIVLSEESNTYSFANDGDFEDVTRVDTIFYALKSSGTLYEIKKPFSQTPEVTKYKNQLTKADNIEGLTYDPANNRLLLAAKGEKGISTERGIWAFDLKTKTLSEKPIAVVSLEKIANFLKNNPDEKLKKDYDKALPSLDLGFSAIAIHPQNGNWYLLSSINKILMTLSPDEEHRIISINKLDKTIHQQPEGMCFFPNGTLYISNEAKDGKPANICKF